MSGDKGKLSAPTVSNEHQQTPGGHSSSSEAEDDPDYTSSSGSSSEEEVTDDDNDGDVTSRQSHVEHDSMQEAVPRFRANENLRSRVTTFLPQIEKSNRELNADGRLESRRIDNVDERDEQYIEMSLGLGVLSERSEAEGDIKFHDDSSTSDDELESTEETDTQTVIPERVKVLPASGGKKKIEEIDSS